MAYISVQTVAARILFYFFVSLLLGLEFIVTTPPHFTNSKSKKQLDYLGESKFFLTIKSRH